MSSLHKQQVPYTQVANEVLRDPNISFRAKGMFAYLYSKPQGWNFSAHRIAKEGKESRNTVLAVLNELENNGYLERKKRSDGKMDYFIKFKSQSPKIGLRVKKPKSKDATVANSQLGDFGPISNTVKQSNTVTKEKKEYCMSILDVWNENNIVVHKALSLDAEKEINKLFQQKYPLTDIHDAIRLYATILKGDEYFWSYKWNLYEFLKRGLKKFEGKMPTDYISNKIESKGVTV